jgi:hypothetical protein
MGRPNRTSHSGTARSAGPGIQKDMQATKYAAGFRIRVLRTRPGMTEI